ncbi:MAG: GtrA family protein [Xanthobacteraceae bacterium]
MKLVSRLYAARAWLADRWDKRSLTLKALSFALVGVLNTLVDFSVFLIAQALYARSPAALSLFYTAAMSCRCASPATVSLVAANMTSWIVAVTGSYVMNSAITFAAESGRKLRWRSYAIFLASGVAGWLANTVVLVFAAQTLLLPVWLAKVIAILASFCVNFSLSHLIVFRARPVLDEAAVNAPETFDRGR